jgi:hypothetical protein
MLILFVLYRCFYCKVGGDVLFHVLPNTPHLLHPINNSLDTREQV